MSPGAVKSIEDAFQERAILNRLQQHRVIYVTRPESRSAVERLARCGVVRFSEGQGRDTGVWLVERSNVQAFTGSGGGAA